MIIHYKILEEKNLLIQKYSINFSIETYTNYMYEVMEKPEWESVTRVLTDARDIDPTEAFKNIKFLKEFRENVIKKKYKNVFIVNSPSSTATTHLYQGELLKKDYDYKYFSTLEPALEELGLDDCFEKIDGILLNFKNDLLK
jgi:hypothetical protein